MSVDRRVREGLRAPESAWTPDTTAAYDAVLAGARRRTVRRRAAIVAAGVVVVAGAGVALNLPDDTSGAPDPAGDPTPGVRHIPPTPTPLDGTWRSGWITPAEVDAALRDQGRGQWVKAYHRSEHSDDIRLTLVFEDGAVRVEGARRSGELDDVDYQTFWLDGHRMTLRPGFSNEIRNEFRWNIEDDRLTLRLLSSNELPFEGMPGDVMQRAIFTVEPFAKVPD